MERDIEFNIINKGEGLFIEIINNNKVSHYGFTHKKGKELFNILKNIYEK